MSVLIIAEHDHQQLHPSNAQAVSAAMDLNQPIYLLVLGFECDTVVQQAKYLKSLTKIIQIDDPNLKDQLAENSASYIIDLVHQLQSVTAIIACTTTFGKNLLPRVAALLGVAQISNVTQILSHDTFEHLIYAGNAIETVQSLDPIQVFTLCATAYRACERVETNSCALEKIEKKYQPKRIQFIRAEQVQHERPDLTTARVVVSGGRGLQSAEKFKLLEALADRLNAAIGATRAAVDAGFVPNEYQVGQTGKVVAPELYIAIGLSGAIQHVAGMKDSKVIVAINKDQQAPIFEIADYGLVADLFSVLPELIEQLS